MLVILQDYQCWCDMRKLETQVVGQRYLTHDSDDPRWEHFRKENKLPIWQDLGHKNVSKDDFFNFARARQTNATR